MNTLWNAGEAKADEPRAEDKAPILTVESINNHVYFYSTVNSDRCLALMKAIREIDCMLRNESASRELPSDFPLTPIWLHINSPGGGLFSGLAVADQLRRIKSPIFSVVEGYCASAATLISMSCSTRYIEPSAFMLIHQLSAFTWGTYEQLKDDMHMFDLAMERLVLFYSDRSTMEEEKVRELLKRDSWFNAKESVGLGLADKVRNID